MCIKEEIEKLRPRLLDLTRRNPLLSTKLKATNRSNFRVINTVLSSLFKRLSTSGKIEIISLPQLGEELQDEQNEQFKQEFSTAIHTDETYKNQTDQINEDDEHGEEKLLLYQRQLKDRLREQLNMPPRQVAGRNISLRQHAESHNINPSYELNGENPQHVDPDEINEIQTLMLPENFQTKLNSIFSKVTSLQQEAGISVFYIAFGFLEWSETNTTNTNMQKAPLILMPAVIEKTRSRTGTKFHVSCDGDDPEKNFVLAEKLKKDFDIDLRDYKPDENIDTYLNQIENDLQNSKNSRWKVRKQVVLGVFPSARMAMYNDLDTTNSDFSQNEALRSLLVGNDNQADNTTFANDYDIDKEEIEHKVPFIITEADSSQYSTLVDVADGKNLAVEGPPGSGKSQTIVNTIAAALYESKKVLFVAEKSAALEVVRSKLQALKLDAFVLPLLVRRGGRKEIIESVRQRCSITPNNPQENIETLKQRYKDIRSNLKKYIDILAKPFMYSGMTVYQILGMKIKINKQIESLPEELGAIRLDYIHTISETQITKIFEEIEQLEEAARSYQAGNTLWDKTNVDNLTPYDAADIVNLVAELESNVQSKQEILSNLEPYPLIARAFDQRIIILIRLLDDFINEKINNELIVCIKNLDENNYGEQFKSFYEQLKEVKPIKTELNDVFVDIDQPENIENINMLSNIFQEGYGLEEISTENLFEINSSYEQSLSVYQNLNTYLSRIYELNEAFKQCATDKLIKFVEVAKTTSEEILNFRNDVFKDVGNINHTNNMEMAIQAINQREYLSSNGIDTERSFDANELQDNLDNIKTSGVFSFLKPSYWQAKNYYKKIHKEPGKFNKEKAIKIMQKLLDFVRANQRVRNDEVLSQIFRAELEDNVNINFKLCQQTIAYYQLVKDTFNDQTDEIIRTYLLEEDIAHFGNLELADDDNIAGLDPKNNQQELFNHIENLTRSLQKIQKYIEIKNQTLSIDNISENRLREIQNKFREYINLKESIDNTASVEEIIGDQFDSIDTDIRYISKIIYYHQKIKSLGDFKDPYYKACTEDTANNLLEELNRFRENYNTYERISNEMATLCNSDRDNLLNYPSDNELLEWLSQARNDSQGLLDYSRLSARIRSTSALEFGVREIITYLKENNQELSKIKRIAEAVIYNNLSRSVYEKHGENLAQYNGITLDGLRSELADKDRDIQDLSSSHIANHLSKNASPPRGIGLGPKRNWTELSLIHNEINKQRGYISPRQLIRRAGKALLELKPCWMMSPLSVAQYIKKGDIKFDLLIIDEASQMTPENAIGAIARSEQVMVVGDTHQLPPTNFFRGLIYTEDEEDEDAVPQESILEIANRAFMPKRRLRWHYRSRHPSLIAFSNKYVYDKDLTIYPSANEKNENSYSLGVGQVLVDGIYSNRINIIEADKVIEHIIDFMRNNHDKSLGVVTMNQTQCVLLEEKLEYATSREHEVLDYRNKWKEERGGLEPFFIKNLENVQGDERDVVFISTVYGPSSEGARVMQTFGPINGVHGKRRLNVLFTRAKEKMVTFTSMKPTDVSVDEHRNKDGKYLLKKWLEYSKTGKLEAGDITNREPDSEFEAHVIEVITDMGYEAIPQVGVSGYFVDIGVRDPRWDYGYIIGVECDGASYHSSKSARDRDRLREEVLTKLGWHIHRIWSTDWFENPRRETEKLRDRIEEVLKLLLLDIH